MSDVGEEFQFQVHVQWMHDPTAVPSPVNQFMVQSSPGPDSAPGTEAFVLSFGHIIPPVIPAFESVEQAKSFGADMSVVAVPVGRISIAPGRLRELHNVIGLALKQNNIP